MSFLSNVMRAVVNPATIAQLAMGPAGWASLAVRTIATAVGQQVIQQLGQRLGLPQNVISLASSAFSAATGSQGGPLTVRNAVQQLAQQIALSPSQQGAMERAGNNFANNLMDMLLQANNAAEAARSKEAASKAASKATSGGDVAARLGISGGFLVQLAEVLGKALDNKMNQLHRLASEMNGIAEKQASFGEITAKNQGKFQSMGSEIQSISALLQGVSQEMNVLSNALKTTLETVGTSQATLARKG